MEECSANAESSDGRTVFAMTASGQLKMPRLGNFCVTMLGDGAADADVARGADFASTSSDSQHGVKSIADGDAKSYWASALDPTAPVDVQVDFGTSRQIKSIEIDWEHPAQVRSQYLSANMWGRRVLSSRSSSGIRAPSRTSREMDDCPEHFQQQSTNHEICRACCFWRRSANSHADGAAPKVRARSCLIEVLSCISPTQPLAAAMATCCEHR